MYAKIILLSLVGYAAANPSILGLGLVAAHDDGQWRPWLDGSAIGSGLIQWGHEDGSWKPHLDGSVLGSGALTWLHRRRRSLVAVNPNALPVPLDTATVALAKNAQLIQQHTEGTRNILGGGIPLALPADTHEVAIGKQAHAIAHAAQKAATSWGHAGVAAVAPAWGHAGIAAVAPAWGHAGVAAVAPAWGHASVAAVAPAWGHAGPIGLSALAPHGVHGRWW